MPDIRPAQASWELIDTLKRVWDVRHNYVPIRIAIGRSLFSGDHPCPDNYQADGRTIDTQQVLGTGSDGSLEAIFRALIVQRHGRPLSDEEFLALLKAHIDHGFELIRRDTEVFKAPDDYVDYLVDLTQAGLEQRRLTLPTRAPAVSAVPGVLQLILGTDPRTREPVTVEFNRRTNNYLAVVGKPGSGKTHLVKDLLCQLREVSEFKLNLVFFDYAKGDVAGDERFVRASRSAVVRLPDESIPINPFSRVNIASEMAVRMAAQEFSDTVRDIERNVGTVQGLSLIHI